MELTDTLACQLQYNMPGEMEASKALVLSNFHFISFLSLLLLNNILLEETLNSFAPMPRSVGDSKMRNTGCPKNLIKSGTVYCCFVITFCFPGCLTRLVINGARLFLAG